MGDADPANFGIDMEILSMYVDASDTDTEELSLVMYYPSLWTCCPYYHLYHQAIGFRCA